LRVAFAIFSVFEFGEDFGNEDAIAHSPIGSCLLGRPCEMG
jgi:hypothetical protein